MAPKSRSSRYKITLPWEYFHLRIQIFYLPKGFSATYLAFRQWERRTQCWGYLREGHGDGSDGDVQGLRNGVGEDIRYLIAIHGAIHNGGTALFWASSPRKIFSGDIMHVYFGATHPSIGLDSDGLDSPLPEPIGRPCSAEDIKFDELKEWCSKALANGTLEHFNDIERRKNAGSVDPDKYKVWHTTIKTAVDDSEPAFWKLVVDEENFDLTNCYRNEPRPNIIRLCARRAVVLPVEEEEAAEEPKASEARSEQQAQGEEGSIEQEDDDREEEEEEEEEESHRGGKRKRDEFEGSSTVQDQSEDQGDDTEPSDGDVSQPESLASKVIGLPTVVDLTLEDSD